MHRFLKSCIALACLSFALGCSSTTESPKATLSRIDNESEGAKCAAGGVSIKIGVDANSNGILDDSEVNQSQTHYVCNGVPGTKGSDGLDGTDGQNGTDGQDGQNGTDGQNGQNGNDGHNALVRITAEEAGPQCIYGGLKIESGIDDDGNGTLSDDEVDATEYACDKFEQDGIRYGNITLTSTDDVARLEGVEVLVGDLTISGGVGSSVSLPSLKFVTGALHISDSAAFATPLGFVDLPLLTRVSGSVVVDAAYVTVLNAPLLEEVGDLQVKTTTLTSLAFPALQYDNGTLTITGNSLVTSVDLSQLRSVAGNVTVSGSGSLTALDLSSLTTLTGSTSIDLQGLTTLTAPSLSRVGAFTLKLPKVTTLSCPALAQATGNLTLSSETALTSLSFGALTTISGNLTVSNNPALTSVDLPALTAVSGTFAIEADTVLANLNAPVLTSTAAFSIKNSALTNLTLQSLQTTGAATISNNAQLTVLSLPALRTTGLATFSDNAQLATVSLPAIKSVTNGSSFSNSAALSQCAVYRANANIGANGGKVFFSLGGGLSTSTACTWSDACAFITVNGVSDQYLYCPNRLSWTDAQTVCRSYGASADLLVMSDATEYATFKSLVTGSTINSDLWIGANDIASEGTWVWGDGVSGYSLAKDVPFWDGVEPNNSGGNEDCAIFLSNGLSNDAVCSDAHIFLCETLAR